MYGVKEALQAASSETERFNEGSGGGLVEVCISSDGSTCDVSGKRISGSVGDGQSLLGLDLKGHILMYSVDRGKTCLVRRSIEKELRETRGPG